MNQTKYADMMVDIETTGIPPNYKCGIWQVGAVTYSLDLRAGVDFMSTINPNDAMVFPFESDPGTLAWQESNNSENWRVAHSYEQKIGAMKDMLQSFSSYIGRMRAITEVEGKILRLWCKGTAFDFPILENAFQVFGIRCPWKYWELYDLRTMLNVCGVKATKAANAHDAYEDAVVQMDDLKRCLDLLNTVKG